MSKRKGSLTVSRTDAHKPAQPGSGGKLAADQAYLDDLQARAVAGFKRFEQQRKGGVPADIDPLDRVHLDCDAKGHFEIP